jgi:DNA-binding transcriptional regulator YiaG
MVADTEVAKDRALALKRVRSLARTDRLRELRDTAGLSQSDVARALDVAPSQVSRWERALTRPNGRHAMELLQLLEDLA